MYLLKHPRPNVFCRAWVWKMRAFNDATIGVTSEADSDGAFPQEKSHHAEPGWGIVIEESL